MTAFSYSLTFTGITSIFLLNGNRFHQERPIKEIPVKSSVARRPDEIKDRNEPMTCKKQDATEVLGQFVSLFESKGWLNRMIGVRSGDARYRLFCSESRFLVYRINDKWGIPPGVPGWPVCMVTQDRVFHDAEACAFPAEEPGSEEWLRLLTGADFEVTDSP